MKRLLAALVVVAIVGAVWYAYRVGWLVSPLRTAAVQEGDAGQRGRWRDRGTTPEATSTQQEGDAGQPERRTRRGAGGGNGRFGSSDSGPVPILAEAARYEDVPVTVDAVGTMQALNTVTIRSQVDGRLLELDFKDGQDVKKGDILARIDPATYQAQYDQAVAKKAQDEAQLANARVDADRYAKLATTQYGSRQQADTQKSLVSQLEAQIKGDQGVLDNDQAILNYTTIRSPIDGRTGIRAVDAGNIVHAADTNGIVVITQLQPIAMIFSLPQQRLTALNAALAKRPVPVQALDSDNTSVLDKGGVEVVDNQVDQTTGTVKVKANFPNANRQLWPGQFVNVRVFVDTLAHAVVIPTAAVQRGPDGPYVYVVGADQTVKLTKVTVGRQDETTAVIQTGLQPPDRVVTTGFARLTDGAHVTVATAAAGPAAGEPAAAAAAPPPIAGAAPATTSATPAPAASAPAPGTAAPDGSASPGERRRHRHGSQQQSEAAPPSTP